MSKTTRVAAILGRLDASKCDDHIDDDYIHEIRGSAGRDLIGTASLQLGSRTLTNVPVYRGDSDDDLRQRGIDHARMVDQKILPHVQNPGVRVVRRKLGEEKVPHLVGKTLFPGYSVKDFVDVVASVYGAEATEKDALKHLNEIFKDIRDDAEYIIKKYWEEISGALLGETAADDKVTNSAPVNEARLTQTQKKLIRRFARDPKGTVSVEYFRGAGVRGASKPEGKREYDAALKLADMGIVEIVDRPKMDYHSAVTLKLLKDQYLDMELPDDLFYLLRDIAFHNQRRQDAEPKDVGRIQFRGRRGPTSAETAKINDLAGMRLVRNTMSDNPVVTEKGAEELIKDKRVKGAMGAEFNDFMDFLKEAARGRILEQDGPVDEDVSTAAELKMYVGQFFNAKDVNPKIGSWYLMPAPDGKPMLFTVTGSKDDKAYGKFGILEFGRPVRNLKETFWYLGMFEYTTGDKIKPATSDIVVSADFAAKLMADLKVKADKVPTPTGEHTPDRFEKTKYTVLV